MDSGPALIEELLKNNYAPSDEAVQEVKRLLLKPMKDLQDLDAEIKDLKSRLSELEAKRSEAQKRISCYESILAPIRRIPADVLGEIFYQCLPTHRNPIMKSTDCPLLLTRVCSPWRTAAMSCPQLWERLYLTLSDDDTVPDLESAIELVRNGQIAGLGWTAATKSIKQRKTEMLWRRFEAAREWLLRSGTRPLSISLSFTTTYWYTVPYSERPHSVIMEFMSLLATLSPRLKKLELKMPPDIYRSLEQIVAASEMTTLTSLRVEYPPNFLMGNANPHRPLLLLQAPKLRQISIAAGDTRVLGIFNPLPSCQWNALTNLSYFDSLTIAETIFLLEHSSNLVHYKGMISEYTEDEVPTFYEGHISLPFLQTFSITEYVKPLRLGNLYDRIYAPSLRVVQYSSRFYGTLGGFSAENLARPSILPLLRKSTALQKFSFDASDLTRWDLGTLLRAIPTITYLAIGPSELREDSSVPTTSFIPPGYDPFGVLDRHSWSFENLIVGDPSEEREPNFLPKLTSLAVLSPTARLSDDTLFDIIKSRMIPTGRMAASLEYVRVIFYREKTRNIADELARYAEHMGVKINLSFKYSQPPAPEMDPISPEFGLNGLGGRTWLYIDAGEDL